MITVADPQILWNDGFYPLVDVDDPGRLVLEAEVPRRAERAATTASAGSSTCSAACSGRPTRRCSTRPGSPPRRTSCTPATTREGDRKGEWFQLYSIGFGGIPGRPLGDGPDGHSLWPSFVNIPCEYLESYYPLRIEQWETVADTGGAGLHRGGNGVDVAYRLRGAGHDRDPRRPLADLPVGRQRRRPRRARHASGSSAPTAPARCCRSKCHDVPVSPGDVLHFVTWGGGGWGDPLERDPELVAWRCAAGWSRAEGARRYGVVRATRTAPSTSTATESLRDQMRADRPGRAAGLRHGPAARGRCWPAARRRPACRRRSRPVPDDRASGPHESAFGRPLPAGAPGRRCWSST